MRNLFCGLAAAAMLYFVLSADADTPAQTKKAPAKSTTAKSTSAPKAEVTQKATKAVPGKAGTAKAAPAKAGVTKAAAGRGKTAPRHTVTAKNGKKAPARQAPVATWRNRQAAPTPDRYKEIQQALAAKGYLKPEDATGAWNQSSVEALQKFQADQKLESTGKINSLSLIALGLGPKHTDEPAAPNLAPNPPEMK